MMVELHSFFFELTIFQDSLFDNYMLFLSSYSCTFIYKLSVSILIRLFPFPQYHVCFIMIDE